MTIASTVRGIVLCGLLTLSSYQAAASIVAIQLDSGALNLTGAQPGDRYCRASFCFNLAGTSGYNYNIVFDQVFLPTPLPGTKISLAQRGGNNDIDYSFNDGEITGTIRSGTDWLSSFRTADIESYVTFEMSSNGFVHDWSVFVWNDGQTFSSASNRYLRPGGDGSTFNLEGYSPEIIYRRGAPGTITVIGDLIGVSPVPVPAALPLLLVAIGSLGFLARRGRRSAGMGLASA